MVEVTLKLPIPEGWELASNEPVRCKQGWRYYVLNNFEDWFSYHDSECKYICIKPKRLLPDSEGWWMNEDCKCILVQQHYDGWFDYRSVMGAWFPVSDLEGNWKKVENPWNK